MTISIEVLMHSEDWISSPPFQRALSRRQKIITIALKIGIFVTMESVKRR